MNEYIPRQVKSRPRWPRPIRHRTSRDFGYIYMLSSPALPDYAVKIGRALNPKARIRQIHQAYQLPLRVECIALVDYHKDVEAGLHRTLKGWQLLDAPWGREWFGIEGCIRAPVKVLLKSLSVPYRDYQAHVYCVQNDTNWGEVSRVLTPELRAYIRGL